MELSAVKKAIKESLPSSVVELLRSLKYVGRKIPDYETYQSYMKGKKGIEIGGPSTLFKTMLPIYQVITSLDGVNFANNTLWEGSIETGQTFNYFRNRNGIQFICEATDLGQIASSTYDILISSNCLEHIANPLRAIEEWKRVLNGEGLMLLVLPNKESNFDHKRPVTSFEHLLDDYENEITEQDLTHLDEILSLHDLSKDPPAGDIEQFRLRSLNNFSNRTLHHHVFDIPLITKMFDYFDLKVVKSDATKTDFFVLGRKM